MSSEDFENLEEDFDSITKEIQKKITSVLSKTSGEARKNAIREIQRDIDRAQRILTELDDHAQSAPNPFRFRMNTRVKGYTHDLAQLKKKTTNLNDAPLFPSKTFHTTIGVEAEVSARGNRERLLQMNETVGRTSQSILNAQQVAAETDQVGIAVVDELGVQRESLIRTKERLVDTDENLSKSRKILRAMYRRVMTNKLILVIAILLEIGILVGIVYYKWFR